MRTHKRYDKSYYLQANQGPVAFTSRLWIPDHAGSIGEELSLLMSRMNVWCRLAGLYIFVCSTVDDFCLIAWMNGFTTVPQYQ